MALPQSMDAERHQVVHQVVAARDRGEYLADELLLLGDRYVAETEVGGAGLLAHGRQCYSLSLCCPCAPCPAQRGPGRGGKACGKAGRSPDAPLLLDHPWRASRRASAPRPNGREGRWLPEARAVALFNT